MTINQTGEYIKWRPRFKFSSNPNFVKCYTSFLK